MLEALAAFISRHSFATRAISSFAFALSGFVFEVLFRFAYTARTFVGFLCGRKRHVFRIARKFTVGGVVFLAAIGGIHGLAESFQRHASEKNDKEYDCFLHW